jgi:D-3-phosphoglycerate dehydrogenase
MSRFKVVVTDQVFPDVEIERQVLGEVGGELEVAAGTREDVLARAPGADALLNTYLPIDRDLIARLQRCRIVARYGIGVDNVDLIAAQEVGIVVTNVPDYCVEEVAAHTLALLLSLLRRLPQADAAVRAAAWGTAPVRPIHRLSGLAIGLVGYGRIARRLSDSLRVLGCRILVHDPYITPSEDGPALVSLEELLRSSDAVSLHAPLTPETRGLIGAPQLELMPEHAVLVNTSRGPLVILEDLLGALRAGRIRGAGLDVFEKEPVNAEALRDVPGLLATPHMAYYSEEAIRESQRKAAMQVVKVLRGEPPDYPVTQWH